VIYVAATDDVAGVVNSEAVWDRPMLQLVRKTVCQMIAKLSVSRLVDAAIEDQAITLWC